MDACACFSAKLTKARFTWLPLISERLSTLSQKKLLPAPRLPTTTTKAMSSVECLSSKLRAWAVTKVLCDRWSRVMNSMTSPALLVRSEASFTPSYMPRLVCVGEWVLIRGCYIC